MCRKWISGPDSDAVPVTARIPSAELSSLEYRSGAPPATKAVDFADLLCPPTGVAHMYDPGKQYLPIIEPYSWWNITWKGGSCLSAAVIGPPGKAVRVDKITGPKDDGGTIPG